MSRINSDKATNLLDKPYGARKQEIRDETGECWSDVVEERKLTIHGLHTNVITACNIIEHQIGKGFYYKLPWGFSKGPQVMLQAVLLSGWE